MFVWRSGKPTSSGRLDDFARREGRCGRSHASLESRSVRQASGPGASAHRPRPPCLNPRHQKGLSKHGTANGAGPTTCASAASCTASRPARHANGGEARRGDTSLACLPRRAAPTAGLKIRSSWSSTTLQIRLPGSPPWYTRAMRSRGSKPKWRAVRSSVRTAIVGAPASCRRVLAHGSRVTRARPPANPATEPPLHPGSPSPGSMRRLRGNGRSRPRIRPHRAETRQRRGVARCEVRCANCHRRQTIRRQPTHLRHHLIEPP